MILNNALMKLCKRLKKLQIVQDFRKNFNVCEFVTLKLPPAI